MSLCSICMGIAGLTSGDSNKERDWDAETEDGLDT